MGKKELILIKHAEGMTTTEISVETGYPLSTVRWAINSEGLKSNKKSPGVQLDHLFQEFVLGSMLGDGSILVDGRISIGHSIKQLEYLTYKHLFVDKYELAGKLCTSTIYNDRYKNGFIEECKFRSLVSDKTAGFRVFYYPDGIKQVPSEEFLLEFLSPFALAIWYMDDGNTTNYSFELNTQSFSVEEIMRLRYCLLRKYGILTTYHSNSNTIMVLAESAELFMSIIVPYIHKSMFYKINPKNRVLYKLGELQERCDANLQPTTDLNAQ